MLISVIIPIYNAEKYLKDSIDSVISQSYKNIEIILVDDGSEDSSPQICDDFSEAYPFVNVIHQENKGVSAARNAGLCAAKGEYLIFLDSDDTLPPKAIESLTDKALETDADLTMGKISANEPLPIGIFRGEELLRMALEDRSIAYYAVRTLYKQKFINDLTFKEGYVCSEDSFFIFECATKKPTVATIDEVVYVYNDNPSSVTHSSFNLKKHDDICYFLNEKEKMILGDFEHLHNEFYNLKVKIQMQLLSNIIITEGSALKQQEKNALKEFKRYKKYFSPHIEHNRKFYFILDKNLYYPFKLISKAKKLLRR